MLTFVTGRHAISETILDDRPPDAEREIPLFEQLAGCSQARSLQLIAVVAVNHALRHAGKIDIAADGVASAFRDDAGAWDRRLRLLPNHPRSL